MEDDVLRQVLTGRTPFLSCTSVMNPSLSAVSTFLLRRHSCITGSLSIFCSTSGWGDSTKYWLCFRTNFTFPYDRVHNLMNSTMPSGMLVLLNLFKYSTMSCVCSPTLTAAYSEYAVSLYCKTNTL